MAVISQRGVTGGRLPRGPHHLSSEEVAEDQRQRLISAMVHLVGERGYAATTVADIIKLAEVSRKTFYAYFTERKDLLLAAFDTVAPAALEQARDAAQRTGGATRQFEALMRGMCRTARESPGTVALSTIEIAAANFAGFVRHDDLMSQYGDLIEECFPAAEKERIPLPGALARMLAGGTHRTIDAHARQDGEDDLMTIAPQLARWVRSYHPVGAGMMNGRASEAPVPEIKSTKLFGGRAPGTLTLAPNGYKPITGKGAPGFVQHSNRERILDAVAQVNAEHGYTAITAQSIADRADLSERAFLAHFKNKDDAFTSAVEIGHIKAQAVVERARAATPDWRTGVSHAVGALLEFLASEPYFTRMAFVDAPLAGPGMTRRTNEHASAYARLLLEGAPQRRRPPQIAPEAIAHGLFELAFHHAAQDKTEELVRAAPVATYLTLAPFLGVSEATEASLTQQTCGSLSLGSTPPGRARHPG